MEQSRKEENCLAFPSGPTTRRGDGAPTRPQPASPTAGRRETTPMNPRDCSPVLLLFSQIVPHQQQNSQDLKGVTLLCFCIVPPKPFKLLSCAGCNQYHSSLPSLRHHSHFSKECSRIQRLLDLYGISRACLFLSLLV